MLTERKLTLLRILADKPRTTRELTEAKNDRAPLMPISARHTESMLADLLERGLIRQVADKYGATAEGMEALADVRPIAPVRSFVNATMREPYRLPQWQVRAGADAHQQCKSRGIGA